MNHTTLPAVSRRYIIDTNEHEMVGEKKMYARDVFSDLSPTLISDKTER